jgi:hypothetical protein
MSRLHLRLRWCLLVTALLILLCPASGRAFDWFKTGRDLLGGNSTAGNGLSSAEIGNGLKEALRVGTGRVVGQLGSLDGFNADPKIHIPLPKNLERARSALQRVGMSGLFDDLELKLNRAAEEATPEAKALFLDAIQKMTLEDAEQIFRGSEDAATRYFQGKMSEPLAVRMQPLVEKSLQQVGAVQSYETAMGQYRSLPFVPDLRADLTRHVIDRGLDGIFYYLAREEAAIRQNPAMRTTELLRKVFGGE